MLLNLRTSRRTLDDGLHLWTFVLFLAMALVMWTLTLYFSLHQQTTMTSSSQTSAHCLTPAEFGAPQAAYAHAVCLEAYRKAYLPSRQADNETALSASLYEIGLNLNDADKNLKKFNPSSELKLKANHDIDYFYFHIPILMIVFAILLRVPQILWSMYTASCGINLQKTLEAFKDFHLLTVEKKRHLIDSVLTFNTPSCFTVFGFFLYKILLCAITIGEVLFLKYHVTLDSHVMGSTNSRSNGPLLCTFDFRMMNSVQSFTIQCQFSGAGSGDDDTSATVVSVYKSLTLIVLLVLVALSVVNVLSLLKCLLQVCLPSCRRRLTGGVNLRADATLLLLLAQENIGSHVTEALAESYGRASGGGWQKKEDLKMAPEEA
ncbi:uncharacterized protein LOC131934869 [Physella acuta]|uniref:uncharacterized protein LOC131934869 n=1 Tax=Physella acuta TaxID=109671 RepID=UPI0027DD9487|nr:uncharacterized protein LOC131934869 [Physella acuta]